jgi:hypothetical protein
MRSEEIKAKELIEKHKKWVNQLEGSYSELEYAKKAAIITVDEILEVEGNKMINGDVNEYDFWEQVKIQINGKHN